MNFGKVNRLSLFLLIIENGQIKKDRISPVVADYSLSQLGGVLLKIMKNHVDLLNEIEIIKGQIEQYELSLTYWNGDSSTPMLGATGAAKFGLSVASLNIDRIGKEINALEAMLRAFDMIRKQNEERINKLEGLGYKIAKLRFIKGMSYKEIADKLDYSYSHVRKIAAETSRLEKVI